MKLFTPMFILLIVTCIALPCFGHGDEEVAEDQERVKATGLWIYNDLEKGIAQAEETGKPILVVFR